ncbi:hypothetical protein RFI_25247 [Reticulomyxa filosa]|uniref:Transmembrane protein n=1 Tax=Reticulomyxa filosa TaxID=46433 RepID=X6MFD6_RETFI|nr:hypothetical protein RFI_25247 [Reticulomyxa filosa]|eukprot:ETO12132.1 hypothetical protein RFI_25247 [Reticulomyxa filosa]
MDSSKWKLEPANSKSTYLSPITEKGKDVIQDVINVDKLSDWSYQKRKLKIAAVGTGLGLFGGYVYGVYRGVTNVWLFGRYLTTGALLGTLAAYPIIGVPQMLTKKHRWAYGLMLGAFWGAALGYSQRGFRFVPVYSIMGVGLCYTVLLIWYFYFIVIITCMRQLVEPIYYFHFLKWPEYDPPIWWPYQPTHPLDILDLEIERERNDVIYVEDLQYFKDTKTATKSKLLDMQLRMELEEGFVKRSPTQKSNREIMHVGEWIRKQRDEKIAHPFEENKLSHLPTTEFK